MKYIILGAGPAGLTIANRLLEQGITSFLVIEKEKEAGGLCRSIDVDGAPMDVGGGHFLDVRRPMANEFLFKFMPEKEWDLYNRDSKIYLDEKNIINHPIEANIWQMDLDNQVQYLKEIAIAGCNLNKEKPLKFIDWIYWKLGKKIAEDYMIPYNKKIFCNELNELGTYWLEKLPNVSFEETLLSCLVKKAYGKQPGHAKFYYPKKYGYGELWKRMGNKLENKIIYNTSVVELDCINNIITCDNGESYQAEKIITTIPWKSYKNIKGMPEILIKSISRLKHSTIQTEYFNKNLNTKAHWIYYPNLKLDYHRVLVRHNFCPNSRGYWTESNIERISNDNSDNFKYINEYAYPLNTLDKPKIMENLLSWCKEHNIYGLGRWGEHEHYNSDVVVEKSLDFVEKLLNKRELDFNDKK